MKLLPLDYAFIEGIQQEISSYSAVPLELPAVRIAKHIQKAAKWFYRWHPMAIQEGKYLIKLSDLRAKMQTPERGKVAAVTLPDSIQYVYNIHKSRSSQTMVEAKYLRDPLSSLNRFSMHTGNSSIGTNGIGSRPDMLSSTLSMYEFSMYNQMTSAGRGISHDWNEYTHRINFLSDVDSDLMLEVGYRVPITALYAEDYFENFVIGSCLKSLATIIGTHDYKLIGNVSVNFDQLRTEGEAMLEEVKTDVKGLNTNSFMFSK